MQHKSSSAVVGSNPESFVFRARRDRAITRQELKPFEKDIYENALNRRYLVVDEDASDRLWDLWQRATSVQGYPFVVMQKNPDTCIATVYMEGKVFFRGKYAEAQKEVNNLLFDD